MGRQERKWGALEEMVLTERNGIRSRSSAKIQPAAQTSTAGP